MVKKSTSDNLFFDNKLKLIEVVLTKKELKSVDPTFAMHELDALLIREHSIKKYLSFEPVNLRSKYFKGIVSKVRSKLRRAHSLFEVGDRSINYLKFASDIAEVSTLLKLKKLSKEILASHASSSERMDEYEQFYKFIKSRVFGTKDLGIKKIIDLGCGLHPFSLVYLSKTKLKKMNYLAIDINKYEQDLLNLFFSKLSDFTDGFNGEAKVINLMDDNDVKKLEKLQIANLVLMLKLTDHLDRGSGHKRTELVLKSVPAKFVLISFPTVTRSGKRMRYPKRRWVEYLCDRLEYSFETFETSNELFYLIEKNN